jgi:hypothetical protein
VLSNSVHLEGVPRGADLAADLAHEAAGRHVFRLHVSCAARLVLSTMFTTASC